MKQLAAVVAALFVVVIGVAPVSGQADGDGNELTEGLDTEIQILNVTQTDEEITLQVAVPGAIGELAPTVSNFGLTDGGQLAEFTVSPVTTAIDTVIVLDTSGSMRGEPLAAAKRAASTFVGGLPDNARVGLVSFGETVTVHQEPTSDHAAVQSGIDGLETLGETALWDGLVTAADLVAGADQPFVVILSDGENTIGSATQEVAISELSAAEVGLYAVAIESSETDLLALEETAEAVGGQYFDTTDISELEALYADIAGRLASRYEITFSSTRTDSRNVIVSVATDDGALATARTTLGTGRINDVVGGDEAASPRILNIPDDARLGLVPSPSPGVLGGGNGLWVGAGLMFAAFAIGGLLMAWPSTEVRLDTAAGADRVAGFNSRMSLAADRLIARRDQEGALDKALDAAGLNFRPGEYILIALLAVVVSSLGAAVLGGLGLGVLMAFLSVSVVFAYLSIRADRRRSAFANQLVDTLTIMTGGLRAGRGLPQAIELVANEAPSPTAEQFQRVVFETRVGRDMTESLLSVADRMKSEDLTWVARAIDINRELGGDLTEMMTNVANTIRDRRRVARQVRALSAEGRASGWVLQALPVLMFLFLLWRTPDNAMLLINTPLGRTMLGVALTGMVIGYFWIRKLVDLKY